MPGKDILKPGTVLFDYRIVGPAGKGGSANVYKAQHLKLPMLVAIKQLKPELTEYKEVLQQFSREAAIIAQLNHPNVVRIHNLKHDPDANLHYIITEFAEEGTLADLLEEHPKGLPVDQVIHIAVHICSGLAAVHRRRIVHRDIKPSNVLLFDTGEEWDTPKICDFGIASEAVVPDVSAPSTSGVVTPRDSGAVGTLHYMSPEQFDEDLEIDRRSDMYALGILLYQLLVGQVPFTGELLDVMWAHTYIAPKPPSEIRPDIPEALEKIVLRALSKRPDQRYQSAAEMRKELEVFFRRAYQVKSREIFEQSMENVHAYCQSLIQRDEYARWADRPDTLQEDQDHFVQTESKILPLDAFPYEDDGGQKRENLLRTIRDYDRLLILGEPGVGKTAALERMVWETAKAKKEIVPVHISLSEYSQSLTAEVYQALVGTDDLRFRGPDDLRTFLRRSRCLFLLDGLNEVRNSQCERIVQDIGEFVRVYRHHRYVVTSRPQDTLWRELRQRGAIRHTVVVQRITGAQVREYLVAHLGRQRGNETYDSLNDRLRGMSRTLLFLWMLKEIRKAGGQVPGNRGELFDRYVEHLFTRDEGKLEISLPRSLKKDGLACLAFTLQLEHRVACQEQEAADIISKSGVQCDSQALIHEARIHGLLIGSQQLRFMHQAVQDYFVAIELAKKLAAEGGIPVLQQLGNRLRGRGVATWAKDDWWAESFVQLAGLVERPSRLAQTLTKVKPWLALWCVIEGRQVDEQTRRDVEANTVNLLHSENLGKRKSAVHELGKIKNPRTAQYLVNALQDEASEVVDAAVRGLGDLGEPSVEYLRSCLDKSERVRQAATRALGLAWRLAQLENLGKAKAGLRLNALEGLKQLGDTRTTEAVLAVARWDSDVTVRQRAIGALGTIGDAQAVETLLRILKGGALSLRVEAAFALGHIGDKRAVVSLLEALRDNDEIVRRRSTSALGRIWELPSLVQLGDDQEAVRQRAASDLREQRDVRVVDSLIAALKDRDGIVCAHSASALGQLGNIKAIKPLIAVLRTRQEPAARSSAAEALGNLGGEQVIEPLRTALYDLEPQVRRSAVIALGKQNDRRVVQPLIEAFQDRDRKVRRNAAVALGKLKDERAIQPLIALCKNEDLQEIAIKSLAEIGEPSVSPLIAALKDQDQDVRTGAIKALGQIRNGKAFETLLSILSEERDQSMRANAAWTLGQTGDTRAVQALTISLRKDGNKWVRFSAAMALGQLGGARAVDALVHILRDRQEDESVWRGAINALGQAWNMPVFYRLCDKDPTVRGKAATALGQLGNKRAIEPLLAVLQDQEERVRHKAISALGQIWDIPSLIRLGDNQVRVRQKAALDLGKLRDMRAIDPLVATLQGDGKSVVRGAAAKALGMMDGKRVVEPLIEALDDDQKDVRQEATKALQQLSQWAVPRLVDALQDRDHWLRRREAAETLGRIKEPEPLLEALRHHDKHVRRSAIDALTELDDIQVVEPIIGVLKDQDHYVRRKAAEALGKSGDAHAKEPLRYVLENDQDWRVKRAAAEALGQVGDASVVESLIVALKDDDWLVREMAAKSLGKIRDERAVSPLIEALEGDWPALWTVAEALGQHGDARAVSSLTAVLQASDEDKYVRDAAVEALGWIGEPIQKSLIAILRSRDKELQTRAIMALGQMRDARDLTPLIDALRHGEPYQVHHGALEALIKLGETAVEPLIAVLKKSQVYDAFARQRAAHALGQIRDARAVEPLIAAQSDKASIVRKEATRALSLINTPEARAAVRKYK